MLKLSHNLGWMREFCVRSANWGINMEYAVELMKQKGLSAVEFYPNIMEYTYNPERMRKAIEDGGLYFYSAHLPMKAGVLNKNKDTRQALWHFQAEWLEFFSKIGVQTVVVHPDDDYYPDETHFAKIDLLIEYARFLGEIAANHGMKLAFETLWEKEQLFTKIEELEYFQNRLPMENIGFCFDTGHVFGTSDARQWDDPMANFKNIFNLIKDKTYNFHIHDTDINSDKHLPLGEGSIDFEWFFSALKELNPDFPVTIEIDPSRLNKGQALTNKHADDILSQLYQPFLDYLK